LKIAPILYDDNMLEQSKGNWLITFLVSGTVLFTMSLWFSASAVVPSIAREWNLTSGQQSLLTLLVQLGFVCGTLASAILNLPDLFRPKFVIAASGLAAALANAVFALLSHSFTSGAVCRFLTGFFLAGVYPPSMKIIASWFQTRRGTALGILIGSLTVGKAFPYLVNAAGISSWQDRMLVLSAVAIVASCMTLLIVLEGPFFPLNAPFDWRQFGKAFKNSGVRLASFGYFGHMWELYAMWTWTPIFLRASFAGQTSARFAELISFSTIAAGGIGCVLAGRLADRFGKPLIAAVAMMISASCCLIVGFFYQQSPWLLSFITIIWGAAVVADSAQFSASVTEHADQRYVGTALTIQTSIGFLLTMLPIWLVSEAVEHWTWQYAFMILAPGPLLGVIAMFRLRRLDQIIGKYQS
jgi:MFS family permease